ncbi:MAG TPA: caspase family protein, partial [Coleofasciculaceae cyanobacterium]
PRKLAMLVGINEYPDPVTDLQGCLNDVELQHELLMHRFGFNPKDIIIVSDNAATNDLKPTRANILRVFKEHLIAQAKPGDVVVFHYSGHGSLVKDPNPLDTPECRKASNCDLNGTLVPNDPLPPQGTNSEIVVPDITGRTLFLLMDAINTENLTVVLDSCYSGASTRGNAVVRTAASRLSRSGETLVASAEELDYQKQWLAQLNLSVEKFQQRRQKGIAKGVALGSASRNQEALDVPFGDFHAGAFTYLLTRYLWQLPANQPKVTVQANLIRSTKAEASLRGYTQVPVVEVKPESNNGQKPFYFQDFTAPPAEAAITKVTGEQIEFWLGGVSSQNLGSANTVFTLLDSSGKTILDKSGQPIELQQTNRSSGSLFGYGKLLSGQSGIAKPGMLLRERIVGIPANPTLRVGLDSSLGDEMEQARTALQKALLTQSVNRIEQVMPVDGQSPVDYIISRMTQDYQRQLATMGEDNLPPVGSLGVFTPILKPVSSSFGRAGESATAAVNRLKPRLKLLLAGKVLQGLATPSSNLQITGEIFAASGQGPRIQIASRGARERGAPIQTIATASQSFRAGEAIQLKVENLEDQELYLSCLAIDAGGNITVLYPANWDAPEEAARIDRSSSLVVPRSEDEVVLRLGGKGFVELLTLISTSPLRNALRAMQTIARGRGLQRGFLPVEGDDPLEVLGNLLGDVEELSRSNRRNATIIVESRSAGRRGRSLDTNTLAAFSTVIQVE